MPLSVNFKPFLISLGKGIDTLFFGSVLQLRWANRVVQSKISECQIEQFESDDRLQHSNEILTGELERTIRRTERIEDKATRTLLGVAVAIAVIGAATGVLGPDGILNGQGKWVHTGAAGLLIAAMVYLIGSGLLALSAYKIGEVYLPTLFDLPPIEEEKHRQMVLVFCIEQNWRVAIQRSNRLSASFYCLIRGLCTVLLFGILIIIATLLLVANGTIQTSACI